MENTKDVGTILREARLAKGLTIAEVEKSINIRSYYLEAIEDNNYEKTPEEVFVKGMIRNYGNFLGLDGLELVNIYKASKAGSSTENVRSIGIREVDKVKLNIQLKDKRDMGSGTGKFEFPVRQFFVGVIACLLIAAMYVSMPMITDYFASSGDNASVAAESAQQPAPAEPVMETSPEPEAAPQPVAATAADTKVVIDIEAGGNCWLEVNADGEEVFAGMLRMNDRKTYEAQDKLIVKYGNTGVMSVKVNGVLQDMQGEQGVSIKTYTASRSSNE